MIKTRYALLSSIILFSNNTPIISINITKKNTLYPGLIVSFITTSTGIILYKKNLKFRTKIQNIKGKTEDYLINNIAVPILIKWEEIKEEGLTEKDKKIVKAIGSGTLILSTLGALYLKYKFTNK